MSAQACLRIGTRGSPLALAQAQAVRNGLIDAHDDLEGDHIEVVTISTAGDRIRDKPLRAFGGKGLFTKEIEEALLDGRIDMAVHSMKDVPTELPPGLRIACLLPREDPRDAFISPVAGSLTALPEGAVIGTSSLRRRAQVRHARPDLQVVEFRGNVQTRLAKLADNVAQATLLACAGLNRLDAADRITAILPPSVMLPAVAQGAVGVEIRAGDAATAGRLAPLNDTDTEICIAAERAFLAALDGSCRTPIAALATLGNDRSLRLDGQILRTDGTQSLETARTGVAGDAAALGDDAGRELLARAGPGFFDDDD